MFFSGALIALCLSLPAQANSRIAQASHSLAEARGAVARADWSAAIAAYRETLTETPKSAAAWAELAAVLQQVGQLADSIDAYQQSIALQPRSLPAQIGIGTVYQEAGNNKAARSSFHRAAEMFPESPIPFRAFASLDLAENNYDDAITHLSRAQQLDPANPTIQLGLAAAYNGKGDLANASAAVNRALAREPGNLAALFLRATVEAAQNRNQPALADSRRLVAQAPESIPYRLLLAKLLLRSKSCAEAGKVLLPLDRGDASSSDVLFLLARASRCGGDTAAARQYTARFSVKREQAKRLQLSSVDSRYRTEQAQLALKNHHPTLALTQLATAIREDPANAGAWLAQSAAYLATGNLQAAAQSADRAIALHRYWPEALCTKGKILKQLGKPNEALAAFVKASLFDPESAEAFYESALIYRDQGDRRRALEAFRKAARIAPEESRFRLALEAAPKSR